MGWFRIPRNARIGLTGAAVALALAGCQTYAPAPLPVKPNLLDRLPMQQPGPVNMDQVATIAAINNPDLRSARLKTGVAESQLFQAGILPNPQFAASLNFPTNQVAGSDAACQPQCERPGTGYDFGLTYDLQTFFTQSAKVASAAAARDQAVLNVLWQEWQTVQQARTLYATGVNAEEKRVLYQAAAQRYEVQSQRSQQALRAGDITFDTAGTDFAALLDARSQLRTTERAESQNIFNIRALIGVTQNVDVTLRPLGVPDIPDRAAVEGALAKVAQVRPDLRALQAGYQSQEESVREAVLAQFPSIAFGVTRSSDTPGDRSDIGKTVHILSIGATVNLPLFDHNQGNIAIQRATRAQLQAEYQARLDQATSDTWRIWNEMQELNTAYNEVEMSLPQLQANADAAERAYMNGDLAALTAVALQSALITREAEAADLKQSLWSDSIALASVLGTQVEPVVEMKESMP